MKSVDAIGEIFVVIEGLQHAGTEGASTAKRLAHLEGALSTTFEELSGIVHRLEDQLPRS